MTQSHLDQIISWAHQLQFPQWGIFHEISSGAAVPLLKLVGFISIFFLICVGIHRYQEQVRNDHGYELFEWVNIIIHTVIWLIFWLMVIFGCFGAVTGPEEWPGCPGVSSLILLGLFMIPVCRTRSTVNGWGESIVINLFQTIFGFLIGSLLMFLMIFNGGGKKKSS